MENLFDEHAALKRFGKSYSLDALDKVINQSVYQRFHVSVEMGMSYHQ